MTAPRVHLAAARGLGDVVADLALTEGQLVAVALPGALDVPPPPPATAELHAHEREVAATLTPRRQRTWVGGRLALRRALVAAGAADAPRSLAAIAADDRGAPSVPPGFKGSIAHKDEVAVALARRDDGWAVGVDVETSRPLGLGLASRILRPEEIATLPTGDDAARGRELLRRFAMKEAIYKAIDPYLRRYVGFLEVALHDGGAGWVVVAELGRDEPRLTVEARVLDAGDVVLAVARARPVR